MTKNEMTVRMIATTQHIFDLSGTGYDPHGTISLAKKDAFPEEKPLLIEAIRGAVLCNEAALEQINAEWFVYGDPMEGALLVSGLKADLDIEAEAKQYPRTDLIPFESEHRFMATLNHNHAGDGFIFFERRT